MPTGLRLARAVIGGALMAGLILVVFAGASVVSGARAVPLPVWGVSLLEGALNRQLQRLEVPGRPLEAGGLRSAGLSVGTVALGLDAARRPDLRLGDLTLMGPGGQRVVQIPEARLSLDTAALLKGRLALRRVQLDGARAVLRRDAEGRFELLAAPETAEGPFAGGPLADPASLPLGVLLRTLDGAMAEGPLAGAEAVVMQAMSLSIDDRRTDRVWTLGDGRLVMRDTGPALSLGLGFGLVAGGDSPARAQLTLVSPHDGSAPRLAAQIEGMAARDLAAQTPVLGWLGTLDAPISGELRASLTPAGAITRLEGALGIGAGALHPSPELEPLRFDSAGLRFDYDSAAGLYRFDDLTIEGPLASLGARGTAQATRDGAGRAQYDVKGELTRLGGRAAEAAQQGLGALRLTLRPDPFDLRVAEARLTLPAAAKATEAQTATTLLAEGVIAATSEGWDGRAALSIDRIDRDTLVALWPDGAQPVVRAWVEKNLAAGVLQDVRLGLTRAPQAGTDLSLSASFSGVHARVQPQLPMLEDADGRVSLAKGQLDLQLQRGWMTAAQGGRADLAGSAFTIADLAARPAIAEVALTGTAPVTAALSLLDALPQRAISRAGLPVDLAEGGVDLTGTITFPLRRFISDREVEYDLRGRLGQITSDRLIPGRNLAAQTLDLRASPDGITISGEVALDGIPASAVWHQPMLRRPPPDLRPFAPRAPIPSEVRAQIRLDRAFARAFLPGLAETALSGAAKADLRVVLVPGAAPQLRASTDLDGLGLAIAPLGWRLAPEATGTLTVEGSLGPEVRLDRLNLVAPGLRAEGRLALDPRGGLRDLTLERLEAGDWLTGGQLRMTPPEGGGPPVLVLQARKMDLSGLPAGLGAGGADTGAQVGPMRLEAERLQLGRGLALTSFRADLPANDGGGTATGRFSGRVNGSAEVRGTLASGPERGTITLTAADAGATLAAAGIVRDARGGALTLRLTPGAGPGTYAGRLEMRAITLRNLPALAALLNAASVVGLIEQLQMGGIYFDTASADLRIAPEGIELRNGVAEGVSVGVSLEGLFDSAAGRLDLSGVLSPLYLVNAIGRPLSRAGEGLFGIAFRLTGSPAAPEVSINPLSLLAPGPLRDLFRAPAAGLAR